MTTVFAVELGVVAAAGRSATEPPARLMAIPIILPLLNDPNEETCTWAARSLKHIYPEAATKAGVK